MLNEILLRDECGPGASADVESAADADVLSESRALEYLVALWSVRALRRRPSVFRSRHKFTFEDEVAGVTGLSGSLVGEQSEARVIEALKAREAELEAAPVTRLALYGPPGTGKSLYVRHLAARLDRPLVRKRASDLLSMWVDGTEQNIAAMFEQANDDNAVLLLDEADSFLRDRRFAHHEWEVTQVNELLTQMEDFGGVLVCATNLFEDLDPAVLRRFDLKIRLDWLSADQAWDLCVRTARSLGIPAEPETSLAPVRSRLQRLTNLAPGDFTAAARGSRLSGQADTWATLVKTLEREAAMKPGGLRRKPGFIDR